MNLMTVFQMSAINTLQLTGKFVNTLYWTFSIQFNVLQLINYQACQNEPTFLNVPAKINPQGLSQARVVSITRLRIVHLPSTQILYSIQIFFEEVKLSQLCHPDVHMGLSSIEWGFFASKIATSKKESFRHILLSCKY